MSDAAIWVAAITGFTTLIGTLGGTLGGYWLSGRNEEERDERAAQREVNARRAARTERLEDQRHEIQRQTLTDLQNVLDGLTRVTAQIVMHDRDARLAGATGKVEIPQELDTGFADRARTAQKLQSRILDDQLRDAVTNFIAVCSNITIRGNPNTERDAVLAEHNRQVAELSNHYQQVVKQQLGEHLRREIGRQ